MLRPAALLLVLLGFVLPVSAQKKAATGSKPPEASPASAESGARLPVKRVVLYKNGVGYFEHSTRVHGNQDLAIDFTTAQLNDVLKSLTVVDLGEGRISSVRYNSIAPLDERLKSLRLPFGESVTQADFLAALRGARVEVRSGSSTATGRLLSVETEQRTSDKGVAYNVTKFSVVTETGEMRNFELGSSDLRPFGRARSQRRSRQVPRPDRFVPRPRSAAHDHLRYGQRRPQHFRQLHQRSAGVEEHVSHHSA